MELEDGRMETGALGEQRQKQGDRRRAGRHVSGSRSDKQDPALRPPEQPVSAYALFFRDTQAAIKGQNPNASFGEVSKIVASMWDSLDADHKNVYKKKTEAAKKEYLKALAAYRASLVSKAAADQSDNLYGGVGSMSSPHMLGSSPSPPGQSLSPLQKKSPLLTSLMEGSSSSPTMQQQAALSPPIQQQALSPTAMCNNSWPPPPQHMNQGMMMHHSPPHMAQSPPHMAQSPPHQQQSPHQQQQQMHMMLGMSGNAGAGSPQVAHMLQNQQQQTGSSPPHSGQQQQTSPPQQQQQQLPQQQSLNQGTESPGFSNMANSPPVGMGGGGNNAQHPNGGLPSVPLNGSSMVQTCLRSGCMNPAIDSPDWDREYCSSECVVSHCRDVFSSWVSTRQTANSNYASVK